MKDYVHVYKRFGNEEYVIHTVVQPNNKVANMKWYIRRRPFVGSTKIDILYEGARDQVSLSQGRKAPEEIWKHKKSIYVTMMDEHIKMRRQKMKEMVANGEKVEIKGTMRSVKLEELAPIEKFVKKQADKNAEKLAESVDVLYAQPKMREAREAVAKSALSKKEEEMPAKPAFSVKDVEE